MAAALALAACKSTPPAVTDAPVVADTDHDAGVDHRRAPRAAFVLIGASDTWVVPIDPAEPPQQLPWTWVGTTGAPPGAIGHLTIDVAADAPDPAPALLVCPAAGFDDPCAIELPVDPLGPVDAFGEIEAQLGLRVVLGPQGITETSTYDPRDDDSCDCVALHGVSTDGEARPEFDLEDPEVLEMIAMSPYEPEEYADNCGYEALRADLAPTSVLGGVVYRSGMSSSNVCNGLNIYDGQSVADPLRPDAAAPTLEFPELRCDAGDTMAELDVRSFEDIDPAEADPDDICSPDNVGELEAFAIDRGRLVWASGNIDNVGGECVCAAWLPLDPSICPSSLDPCGTAKGFDDIDPAAPYWVSTDGEVALTLHAETVAIHRRDRGAPVHRDVQVDHVLGVEFHPDSVLRQDAMPPLSYRVEVGVLDEADRDLPDTAKAWGNRCFEHLRAGRLDAAQAACFVALAAGGDDRTRGALTYNLGRIEEAQGRPARARAYYERSDRLRPGNAAVTARLQALASP